jgi:hypothetical protein
VTLRSGFIDAWPLERKLTLWLTSLTALTAFNVGLWIWIARSTSLRTPYGEVQIVLSGLYVGVCGFRALFPRVDLERVCLWDTWLSAILLGRTAATVAELCFAVQCALCVYRLSEIAGLPLLAAEAHVFVPLVVFAEILCWYAVLSLNHIGHAIEESLWALLMLLLSAAFGTAALATHGLLREMLVLGAGLYAIASGVTFAFDVRMYLQRWRRHAGSNRLTLVTGLRDIGWRRHPTVAWEDWRAEVPWMTLYFSVGVWTSLAMVLLEWAATVR